MLLLRGGAERRFYFPSVAEGDCSVSARRSFGLSAPPVARDLARVRGGKPSDSRLEGDKGKRRREGRKLQSRERETRERGNLAKEERGR